MAKYKKTPTKIRIKRKDGKYYYITATIIEVRR